MEIKDLLEKIQVTDVENSKLYFITRLLKEGVPKRAKMIDKYVFKVYQIDIDDEIRQYLYDCSQEELERVIKKEYQMIDYDVISDDTEHLFTYKINNKALPFQDIVRNKLSSNPPKAQSIAGIVSDDEDLWAYCIGFNDVENSDWIYTFRKIQPSKVAVDEKDNDKSLLSMKTIRTLFSTTSQKLELLKGETVNLDKQIDCVFYDDTFYIIKKGNFEQIVGLQEEFKEQATSVVSEMKESQMFEGLEKIDEEIDKNPSIHKNLFVLPKSAIIEKSHHKL